MSGHYDQLYSIKQLRDRIIRSGKPDGNRRAQPGNNQGLAEKMRRHPEEEAMFILGMMEDLDKERRRAEEAEEKLSSIFRATPDLLFEMDIHGTVHDCRVHCMSALSLTPEQFTGRNVRQVFPGETAEIIMGALARASETGCCAGAVYSLPTEGGTRFFELSIASIAHPGAPEGRFIVLARDVTERRIAEEERAGLENQLLQSQKMEAVGSLAGSMAHDFNNILTAILGNAELALDSLRHEEPDTRKISSEVQAIQLAAERAAALTRQLLMFSRKEVVKPEILDLNKSISGMREMIRRLIPENIEIEYLLHPDVCPISADARQMEQVIMNLVVNARDAMPEGGRIMIRSTVMYLDDSYTTCHGEARKGLHTVLIISDTGQGMDEATMKRIFEPFFTTKEPGRGTGLGLSSIYGIIRQAGGHITVYSQPGLGSSFKVHLPLPAAAPGCSIASEQEAAVSGGTETILFCEDDENVRSLGNKILTSSGYHVIEAANGQEAIRLCMEHAGPIHLLLTDVIMPGMNGNLLAGHIRRELPGIRTLFMSGYTDELIQKSGVPAHDADLIMKPFTRVEFLRKIRSVLDRTT